MRMAASVGRACRPFTATRWKPPTNHMARMMAFSRKSTTLQEKAWSGETAQPGPAHLLRCAARAGHSETNVGSQRQQRCVVQASSYRSSCYRDVPEGEGAVPSGH